MAHIKPQPLDEGYNAYLALLGREVNSKKLLAGTGIAITYGTEGTTISVNNDNRKDNLCYKGLYNISNSYSPLDLVYVDPNQTYLNESGSVIPLVTTASYTLPCISGGLFVCCTYVPSITATDDSFIAMLSTLSPEGSYAPAQCYRWLDYNVYYPIAPIIPSGSQVLVPDVTGATVLANNTFWTPISPMIPLPINTCTNGTMTSSVTFINGVISGSTFDLSTLPYIAI